VLCQSASFWWLADHPKPIAQVAKKYWLSVGNQETSTNVAHTESLFQRISQIEGVEGMAKLLRDQGATVRLNEYEGGHALDPWRNEFASALHWLLSTKP
jgi:enterochelin esterase-like enzyme